MSLTPLQRSIMNVLRQKGGKASTRQISEALGAPINGIAQSLGALDALNQVSQHEPKKADTEWQLA